MNTGRCFAEADLIKTAVQSPVKTWRSEQMQNVSTMIRRPVSVGSAAASSLLAFAAGAVISLAVPAVATGVVVTKPSAPVSSAAVGAQQIAHDRSEQGLGSGDSVGAQQIAHNRSESGLTDK